MCVSAGGGGKGSACDDTDSDDNYDNDYDDDLYDALFDSHQQPKCHVSLQQSDPENIK